MYAFFKPVLILFIIVVVFFYILINSNTVETTTEVYTAHSGLPQQRANYVFHWDRFGNYIISTPERIKNAFRRF